MTTPLPDERLAEIRAGLEGEPDRCEICGGRLTYEHDHQPDLSGLDDGPYLPGHEPRKKPAPKPAAEIRDIRARAWATRRQKYGQHGHR